MPKISFVFDVEAVGLHGEGFAVGWCVVDGLGAELDSGFLSVSAEFAKGADDDRRWVAENILPILPSPTISFDDTAGYFKNWMDDDPHKEVARLAMLNKLHNAFWEKWIEWKDKGATLWADCGWPVESRFLAQCVDADPEQRKWNGPYPLGEIATVLEIAGMDPLAKYPRFDTEIPIHNPTADARQSARLLVNVRAALKKIKSQDAIAAIGL